ncbi:hypothetical protein STCU_10371 [Strigomonas culicis]|uniref:Transmembrane protein n=1 Tax=Strigomonas culicis TaxID=28005 RepID=S9TN68_9TRYP|nr:hypothetical protein STCU_10371 [Strigomonas culicis]|eukprot:EPY17828.1 hypothetical protein STCU_10371 [Strigomonas culicis]
MVSGIMCRDTRFGFVYAGTTVVVVTKGVLQNDGAQSFYANYTTVRTYSLGALWATHCFFKSTTELYIPIQNVLQAGIPTAENADNLTFLVLNRMSGEFMRFEKYGVNASDVNATLVYREWPYKANAVVTDNDTSDKNATNVVRSAQSAATTDGNSTPFALPSDYLGIPVSGATSGVLGIWPFRYGSIGIISLPVHGADVDLQVTLVRTPLYVLRHLYKRPNHLQLLYACGFTDGTLGTHTNEEDEVLAAASWEILELQEDYRDMVATQFGNGSQALAPMLLPLYNYSFYYKDYMQHMCADCVLVKILAVDDNTGMLSLWRSRSQNTIFMTFFNRTAPSEVKVTANANRVASTSTTVPSNATTGTTTSPKLNNLEESTMHEMIVVFTSLCNVTVFIEDTYTSDLYVAALCPDSSSYIARVTRSTSTLTLGEMYQLSYNTDINPFVPIAASIDYESRTLDFLIPLNGSYAVYEMALFGVYSMDPVIIDSHRGSIIYLFGYGFTPNMSCVFPYSATRDPVVFYDTTFVSCIAPQRTYLSCDPYLLQVAVQDRHTIMGLAPIVDGQVFWQFPTLVIVSAVNSDTGLPYSFLGETNVTVTGSGFFADWRVHTQLCRLWSPNDDTRIYLSSAMFHSATEVLCTFPSMENEGPLAYPSQIDVSLDGFVFSSTFAYFGIYGNTVAIAAASALLSNCTSFDADNAASCVNTTLPDYINTTAGVSLVYTAASVVYLDPIRVSFVDLVGHQELPGTTTTEREITATLFMVSNFNDVTNGITLLNTTLNSTSLVNEQMGLGSYTQVVKTNGTTIFSDLTLLCPSAGEYVLSFSTTAFEGQAGTTNVFNVSIVIYAGAAYRPLFAVLPSSTAYNDIQLLEQQPVVAIVDVCNNTLPSIDSSTVENVRIRVELFNHRAYERWNLTVRGNLFYANNVSIYGPQTDYYSISLRAIGLPVEVLQAAPVYVAWCEAGFYAIRVNGTCMPCPEEGICNGTDVVLAKDGYWHRNAYSLSFVDCSPPYGSGKCLPEGGCATGHDGIACKRCVSGYHAVGYSCEACPSRAVSNFLSFLIVVAAVVFCVVWVACMSIVTTASVHIACIKLIVSTVQVLSLFFYVQFSWSHTLQGLFTGLAYTTNFFSYAMNCSFKNDTDYVIFIIIFPVALVIFCTVLCRFLVLVRFDRVNPVNVSSMMILAYTHRRRLLTEDVCQSIADRLHNADASEKSSTTYDYSDEDDVFGRVNDARQEPDGGRTVLHSTPRYAPRGAYDSFVYHHNNAIGDKLRSIASVLQLSDLTFKGNSERDVAMSFEEMLISSFEHMLAGGEGEMVELLATLDKDLLHRLQFMRLTLPSLRTMRKWMLQSTQRRSKAIGNPTVRCERHDKAKHITIDKSLHQVSLFMKHTALGSINIPLRLGHSIEEQYRAEAVLQFRRSWMGILLNTFATVFVTLYMTFLVIPLMWQRCDTLVEGLNNEYVTRYSYLFSNKLCDQTNTINLRNTSRAVLVLYGVVAPVVFLLISLYYRRRYGLDVMYAAFPVLYFNTLPSAWWQEYSFFLQKFITAIIFTMCKSPLLQAGLAVWLQALRFLYDTLCIPHEPKVTKRTPLQVSLRVMTLFINAVVFLILNALLLIIYLEEEIGTMSTPMRRFLSSLVFTSFIIILMILVGYVVWELVFVLFCSRRLKKTREEVHAERRHELSVLCLMYKQVCATSERYLKLTEDALRMALRLDEKARNKNQDDRCSLHDSFSSLLEPPSDASRGTDALFSDEAPTHQLTSPVAHRGNMSTGSEPSKPQHSDEFNPNLKDLDALSCGIRADFSFLSQHPSYVEPAMEPPVTNPNWLPLTEGEQVKALPETPAVAGSDLKHSIDAPTTTYDANRSVLEQFERVKKPRSQPNLHRCDSLLFSIRNLPPAGADPSAALTRAGSGASAANYLSMEAAGKTHEGVGSMGATDARPAPQHDKEEGGGAFSGNLTVDMEALLAAPIPDFATHFDPFAVTPLPLPSAPTGCPAQRSLRLDRAFTDAVQRDVQLLGHSVENYRALAQADGVNAAEAQSLLDLICSSPLDGGVKAGTEGATAGVGAPPHASGQHTGEGGTTPAVAAGGATEHTGVSQLDRAARLPPPLPTFRRPVEKARPPQRRKVHPKHKKVMEKKPTE